MNLAYDNLVNPIGIRWEDIHKSWCVSKKAGDKIDFLGRYRDFDQAVDVFKKGESQVEITGAPSGMRECPWLPFHSHEKEGFVCEVCEGKPYITESHLKSAMLKGKIGVPRPKQYLYRDYAHINHFKPVSFFDSFKGKTKKELLIDNFKSLDGSLIDSPVIDFEIDDRGVDVMLIGKPKREGVSGGLIGRPFFYSNTRDGESIKDHAERFCDSLISDWNEMKKRCASN